MHISLKIFQTACYLGASHYHAGAWPLVSRTLFMWHIVLSKYEFKKLVSNIIINLPLVCLFCTVLHKQCDNKPSVLFDLL